MIWQPSILYSRLQNVHLPLTLSTSETKYYWRTGNQMLDLFLNLALFKESAIFTCFKSKMFIFSNEIYCKILFLSVFRSYWEKYEMHEKGCCIEIFIVLISDILLSCVQKKNYLLTLEWRIKYKVIFFF